MKLTIAITPELRFRLAYAETLDIEVPEPAQEALAPGYDEREGDSPVITIADYRELQAQHGQLQSRLKAELDMLREMLGFVDGPKWQALIDERKAHDWLGRIEALLAGQVPDHIAGVSKMVVEGSELSSNACQLPEGWQLVPVEPTVEISDAGARYDEENYAEPTYGGLYRAMLAAAPKLVGKGDM